MGVRIVLGCAAVGAVLAAAFATDGDGDFRARAFVIRVPPQASGAPGLEQARGMRVLRRAVALADGLDLGPAWLAEHSKAELTSRGDLAFTVEAGDPRQAAYMATAYARAFRAGIATTPGLATRVWRARHGERTLGPLGWALLGGAAGLWLGAALAILVAARATRHLALAAGATRHPGR